MYFKKSCQGRRNLKKKKKYVYIMYILYLPSPNMVLDIFPSSSKMAESCREDCSDDSFELSPSVPRWFLSGSSAVGTLVPGKSSGKNVM